MDMIDNEKKIAFCGTRGIPANYGGFETAVDEISIEFVKNGYDCDVFCRENSYENQLSEHRGRNLVYVSGSKYKSLDTVWSSIKTGLYLLKNKKKYKHIFWFNNANFPGIMLSLVSGIPVTVNTDGLEWRRAKWSFPFKLYYILSSFIIARTCKILISDSIGIQDYYRKKFFKKTYYIPYGTPKIIDVDNDYDRTVLDKYGLEKDKYFLQITRFEPDNLPLDILKGFKDSKLWEKGYKMVLIGYKEDSPYSQKVMSLSLKNGITILKAIYDPKVLAVLRKNSYSYVHGNSVGGTNPALLEAMGYCKRIMAININFSKEVLGELGLLFDRENISEAFISSQSLEDKSILLRKRVTEKYRWDKVSNSYMSIAKGKYIPYE